MNRIVSFDFLRIFLAIVIVFYHAEIVDCRLFKSGYLAVECFFILSGYLLASSFFKHTVEVKNVEQKFGEAVYRRFCRLYPEYIFVTFLSLICFSSFIQEKPWHDLGYNLIMFGHLGTSYNIVPGSWFVGALFWGSFIYLIILSFCGRKTLVMFAPLIFIGSTVLAYHNSLNTLGGANYPLWGFISLGILRALAGLSCGLFVYFLATNKVFVSRIKMLQQKLLLGVVVFLFFTTIYLFLRKDSLVAFNIYFAFTPIVLYLAIYSNWGSKVFGYSVVKKISDTTYMLFLTNILTLNILSKISYLKEVTISIRMPIMLLCCFGMAYICNYSQRWFFKKLNGLLIANIPGR